MTRTPTIELAQARHAMSVGIANCTSCDQRFAGKGPVLPSGPTPNDLMVLVDAPTRADDRARKVTHAGDPSRLLLTELRKAGVDRAFFAHVVSCWPGDGGTTVRLGRACTNNLRAQIRACDPAVIIALGAHAHDSLAPKPAKVKDVRGRPFQAQAGPAIGRWVFPTWHPAAFKHDGRDRSKINTFSADIASAVRLLHQVTQ